MDIEDSIKYFDAVIGYGMKITSLLTAVFALTESEDDSLRHYNEVQTLLGLCLDSSKEASMQHDECYGAFNSLRWRIMNKPQPGDQIPAELVSGIVLHAIEPTGNKDWQYQATEIGKMLLTYAGIHQELAPLVTSWVNFVRKHGGDARLHQHKDGTLEVCWYGSLDGSAQAKSVNG
jgi:hypothetical protein